MLSRVRASSSLCAAVVSEPEETIAGLMKDSGWSVAPGWVERGSPAGLSTLHFGRADEASASGLSTEKSVSKVSAQLMRLAGDGREAVADDVAWGLDE
eukprot:2635359-Pyramimonas_sp.AAC.1